jgi:NADP-dependent 3-hydroxy acid dehydrogenase YdfG
MRDETWNGARMVVVGASAGIGRAIGERAARLGADVAFCARRVERLEAIVAELVTGHAVEIDVADESSVAQGVARAADVLGSVDVVVYASGVGSLSPLATETAETWQRMFAVNVVGVALVVREVLPFLAPGATVLVCSSTNAHRRLWGMTGYGATKAAVDRLVDGLRDEHPEVRFVRAVIGTTIGTEFGDGMDPELLLEAMPRWVVAGQQTSGMMAPEEVAEVAIDVLATLRRHPNVEIPILPLDPIGGPLLMPANREVLDHALERITAALATAPSTSTGSETT